MIPKKGSRPIIVDRKAYRYKISHVDLSITEEDLYTEILISEIISGITIIYRIQDRMVITPKDVETAILLCFNKNIKLRNGLIINHKK